MPEDHFIFSNALNLPPASSRSFH